MVPWVVRLDSHRGRRRWVALAVLLIIAPPGAIVAFAVMPKTVVALTNVTSEPMCDVHVSLTHDRRVTGRVEPGGTVQFHVKAGGDPYIAVSYRSCEGDFGRRRRVVAFGYFCPYDTIELALGRGMSESSFHSSSGRSGHLEPYTRDAWPPYYRDPFGTRE